MMWAMSDPSREPGAEDLPLLTRQGERGKSVIALEAPPLPAGPLIVEVELLEGERVSLSSLNRLGLADESLVTCWEPGAAGRSLVFPQEGHQLRLRVKADGLWELRVYGLSAVRPLESEAHGTGDDVLAWAGEARDITITYHGDNTDEPDWGAVIAAWYAPSGAVRRKDADLLLIDSEPRCHLAHLPGPGLLVVQSTGEWSVNTR